MKLAHKIVITLFLALSVLTSYGQKEIIADFDNGVKLLKEENFANAIVKFTAVLNKATDKMMIKLCYIYRAYSYDGLSDFKNAIDDLDKAIETDPTDIASYTDRGKEKAYANDLPGARKDFEYILSKDSTTEQGQAAFYYLAKIEYLEKNYEASIKLYDRFILLNANDAESYFNRGAVKGVLLRVEEAIKDYDRAIVLDPKYKEAYANRGVEKINLLTKNGNIQPSKSQTSDACADLKRAKQLGDNTVDDMIFVYCDKK